MGRTCTVCTHAERHAIDQALVAVESPYRDIARQYGLSKDALLRHKADHLLPEIVAAWQAERHGNGIELADELRGWMTTISKLMRACDDWLTDPGDPERFTLAPHTTEIVIHTEETQGPDSRPLRRKLRLSEALARVDGAVDVGAITLVEAKTADPRKLILDTAKALEGQLRLLGELLGKIQTQGTVNFLASGEWLALRGRMLAALEGHPDARVVLAGALEDDDGRAA